MMERRIRRTRGPPYTANEEVKMNLMGVLPWARVDSRRERTESMLILTMKMINLDYRCWKKEAHLDTKLEVVFRATRHDAVQAVHSVGNTELGSEKCLNLSLIAQIGLDDDCLGASRSLGLNDIGKNEVNIGGERIVVEGGGEL